MAILDITQNELTEVYQYIQVLLGGMEVDVDVSEKEIEVLMCKSMRDYLYEIQTWQTKNQFTNIYGQSASVDFTNKFVMDNMMLAQRISDWFASMQRVGGKTPWKKDYITLETGRQVYNLANDSSEPYPTGQRKIHRIMWIGRPEMFQNYTTGNLSDPGVLAFGQSGLMLGNAPMSYLGNLFDYVLLGQAFEMRNKILRSDYFFNLSGDMLELTPTPGASSENFYPTGSRVYYYYFDERDMLGLGEDGQLLNQTDINQLIATPYQVKLNNNIPYSDLNSTAKVWIENYTIALAKYVQASKWRKVRTIASPNSSYQIEFDYQSLIDESRTMQDDLKIKLQENLLSAIDTVKMMEDKATIAEAAARVVRYEPRTWSWY